MKDRIFLLLIKINNKTFQNECIFCKLDKKKERFDDLPQPFEVRIKQL